MKGKEDRQYVSLGIDNGKKNLDYLQIEYSVVEFSSLHAISFDFPGMTLNSKKYIMTRCN